MTSPVRAPRPTPRQAPAAPARAERSHLRVVAPPVARPRVAVWVAIAAVLVFGGLLASAVFHAQLVSGQANLDRIDGELRAQQEQLQKDQLRLADYQSPERIARAARRLGMVPATDQVWVASDGGSSSSTDQVDTSGGPSGSADQLAANDDASKGTR